MKIHILWFLAPFLLATGLAAAEVGLGPAEPVSNLLKVGQEQIDPQLAIAPAGTFAVWSDPGRYEVQGAFNGVSRVIDHAEGLDYVGWPTVAAGGRVFLVVWRHNVHQGHDQVLAQRFNFSGQPVDAQPMVLDVSANAYLQQYHTPPSIAFDGSSFFLALMRGMSVDPTASTSLLTIRIGEDGPPFAARETPAVTGLNGENFGPRTVRTIWTGDHFLVAFSYGQVAHAAGIYFPRSAGTMRFDRSNTLIDKTMPPILYNPNLKSYALATTLTGSRLSYAWVDQFNDIQVAQTKLTGEAAIIPRRVVRRSPTDRAAVVDMAWNGSEHVLIWLDSVDETAATVRAIRLDAELRAIDAEPFDISAFRGPLASTPSLIATPSGVTVAYSRYQSENGGAGRIFVRTLDALSAGSLADLTINGAVNVTPNPVQAGGTVTVKYQVRNQGGGAAGATTTHIAIKRAFGVVVVPSIEKDFQTGSIAAGTVVDETRELTLPAASTTGAYTVTVNVDNNDVVAQTSRANDSRSATLNVLELPSCSFTLVPAEVSLPGSGGSGSIRVTVSNQSCQWSVSPERDGEWLTIRAVAMAQGNGTIIFTAPQNPSKTAPRSVTLLIGNTSAVVRQDPYVPHRRVVGR